MHMNNAIAEDENSYKEAPKTLIEGIDLCTEENDVYDISYLSGNKVDSTLVEA